MKFKKDYLKHYDEFGNSYDKVWRENTLVPSSQISLYAMIEKELPKSYMDIGCASCLLLKDMQRWVKDVSGIEIDKDAVPDSWKDKVEIVSFQKWKPKREYDLGYSFCLNYMKEKELLKVLPKLKNFKQFQSCSHPMDRHFNFKTLDDYIQLVRPLFWWEYTAQKFGLDFVWYKEWECGVFKNSNKPVNIIDYIERIKWVDDERFEVDDFRALWCGNYTVMVNTFNHPIIKHLKKYNRVIKGV